MAAAVAAVLAKKRRRVILREGFMLISIAGFRSISKRSVRVQDCIDGRCVITWKAVVYRNSVCGSWLDVCSAG